MIVDLQIAEDLADTDLIPAQAEFDRWADAVKGVDSDSELTIRIVTEEESGELNLNYRDKTGPTNVLSFPFEMPDFGFDDVQGGTKFAGAGKRRSDDVQGSTKFAGAGKRRSDDVQGGTKFAGAGKRRSDEELVESQHDEFKKMHMPLLGDLVICAAVVRREAAEQHKSVDAHWAHMTIHGILHLLGYDHIEPDEENEMETLEITLLSGLGYPTPY